MRKLFKGISLTWSMLKKLAKPHRKMLGVQTLVYSLILCYNVVIVPLIISRVYQALEMQDAKELYITCIVGSLLILVSFILCYLNNVYLDLNSFRISLTAAKNACLSLFSLNYDKMNVDYTEGEIQNRISAGVDQIAGVFPLLVSVFTNMISIMILLMMAGEISLVLLCMSVLVTGAGYLVSKYESKCKEKYEKIRQSQNDKMADSLYYVIHRISFSKMYEAADKSWKEYQEIRETAWKLQWKQERTGLYSQACMDMLTSVLHGFLGWSLFGYYQRGKVDSENIASSFTIFDQLKSVTVNFSFPISVMRTSMVSVRRLDELFGYACPVEKNICKQDELLRVNQVCYRNILENISVSIRQGEKVAIIGKSGCGKSTLLRLISGMYHPESGQIVIGNKEPGSMNNNCLRKWVTYMPSTSYLYSKSVKENILMGTTQENVRELDEVCRRADIWEIEEENDALSLSGGQAQRVNIARGMLNKAPLLLADEPDAGLPLAQGEIIMKNILSSSDTVIVITHHYQYLDLFTRVLLIEDRKLIADNAPEQIKSHPGYISWRGEVD